MTGTTTTGTTTVDIKHLKADPDQPRQEFDQAELDKLMDSIKRQGVLQPLAVENIPGSKDYLILDGERRYRASTKLGLKVLPVKVYAAMDEKARLMTRWAIQEQQVSWSSFDKARAILAIKDSMQLAETDVANMLGLTVATIQGYIYLMRISKRSQGRLAKLKLPFNQIRALGRVLVSVQEDGDANAVEDAIVKRMEDGHIKNATDVQRFKYALVADPKKAVHLIVNRPTMTGLEIIKATGGSVRSKGGSQISYLSSSLSHALGMALKTKSAHELTEMQMLGLSKTQELITRVRKEWGLKK